MYKTLKISTIVILVILLISGLVALSFRNVVSVMAYPIGALFAYYAVVLIVIISLKKQFGKLLVIAIIWMLCGIQKKPTLGQAHLVFANAKTQR